MAASIYDTEALLVVASGLAAYFLPLGNIEPKSFLTKLLKKVVPVLLITTSLLTWAYTGKDPLQTFACLVLRSAPQCKPASNRVQEGTPVMPILPNGSTSNQPSAPASAPVPLVEKESPRDFFKRNLKRLLQESEPVLEQFVSNNKDSNRDSVSEVNKWVEETSQWICFNMGKTAALHFLDPNPIPFSELLSSKFSQTKVWLLFHRWRENLSTLIEKDDWDPVDKPDQTERSCSWHEHDALAIALSKLGP